MYWPANHRNTKNWQINLQPIAIPAPQNKFKLTKFLQRSFRVSKSFDLNILLANSIQLQEVPNSIGEVGFWWSGSNNTFTLKIFVLLGFEIIQSAICNRTSVFTSTSIETFSSFLLSSFVVTIFVSFASLLIHFKRL